MDYCLDKERSHKILNDYLNNNWVIVEQNFNPNDKTNIILRKKI
jgi:hypothetical protein